MGATYAACSSPHHERRQRHAAVHATSAAPGAWWLRQQAACAWAYAERLHARPVAARSASPGRGHRGRRMHHHGDMAMGPPAFERPERASGGRLCRCCRPRVLAPAPPPGAWRGKPAVGCLPAAAPPPPQSQGLLFSFFPLAFFQYVRNACKPGPSYRIRPRTLIRIPLPPA